MTNLLTLTEVKLHLRVDGVEEDALIELYADAAVEAAEMQINRRIVDAGVVITEPDKAININPAIRAALLLIIGDLYAGREDKTSINKSSFGKSDTSGVNKASYNLLLPYRVGWGV